MSLWTVCHLEAFVSDNESAARTCTPWTTSESAFSLKLLITTLGLSNGGIIHQVSVWKRFMWGARPQQFKGRRRTAVAEVRKTRAYSSVLMIHAYTSYSDLHHNKYCPVGWILSTWTHHWTIMKSTLGKSSSQRCLKNFKLQKEGHSTEQARVAVGQVLLNHHLPLI